MKVDLASAVETYHFALSELGSEQQAMAVVLRAYSLTSLGQVERRPLQLVLNTVCAHFGVSQADLLGVSRKGSLPRARRMAMWILKSGGESYQGAANALGRTSHTDAISACRTVEASERDQAEVRNVAQKIAARLPEVKEAPVIYPRARVA